MPINLNLWNLMLGRWLHDTRDANDLTTRVRRRLASDTESGEGRWRDRPPPRLNLDRLTPHLRRDIGLDWDRL
jgi:uncharacterized protein YjiS (DUF1127 family)